MKNRAFDYSKWPDWIEPGDVAPYERNAKEHPDAQVEIIANSIRHFGWQQDCVITRDNVLVIGHGRRLAAMRIGCKMPFHRVDKDADELTDAEINALRLADNKTNESAWNIETLNTELIALQASDLDMTEFGFDDIPRGGIDEPIAQEDGYDIDAPVEPKAKLGDIYKLGRHRLMCGDSTNAADIQALMNGEKADMLLTDPPYNVALGQDSGHEMRPSEAKARHRRTDGAIIKNDAWESAQDFEEFLQRAFMNALEFMKPGAAFYVWYAENQAYSFMASAINATMKVRQILIWIKSTFTLGRQDYQWQHEPCLYGWKDGAAHYFTDDRKQATVFDDQPDFRHMKKDEMQELLERIYSPDQPTTILRAKKPAASELHPTMKPVKLMGILIRNSSRQGEIILDEFGGSGTTLITCEQMNRRCRMMELDPHYVDVIISRWEALTGEKAVKI